MSAITCFFACCVIHGPPNPEIDVRIGLKSEKRKTQNSLGGTVLQSRLNGIPTEQNLLKQIHWHTQKVAKQTGEQATKGASQQIQQTRRFMPSGI